ncbi:ROK family protein [Kocuria rhizophila]|nr:ROK family protein [Kocuria rhizophila]
MTQARIARRRPWRPPPTVSSIVKELTRCDLPAGRGAGSRGTQGSTRSAPAPGTCWRWTSWTATWPWPWRTSTWKPSPGSAASCRPTTEPAEVRRPRAAWPTSCGTSSGSPLSASCRPGSRALRGRTRAELDSAAHSCPAGGNGRPGSGIPGADRPVVLENDANAGAVGEHSLGAGADARRHGLPRFSHGWARGWSWEVGALPRATGSAGEIGHVTLDQRAGLCRCGNRGCLETRVPPPCSVWCTRRDACWRRCRTWWTRPSAGDRLHPGGRGFRGLILGGAAAQLCNLLTRSSWSWAGNLARAGDLLLEPLRRAVEKYT